MVGYERLPVRPDDLTPYVLVAFSSEHYHIPDENEALNDDRKSDLEALLAMATKAAETYFSPSSEDLEKKTKAFWLSANCMPFNELADEHGVVHEVDECDRERLMNQDVRRPEADPSDKTTPLTKPLARRHTASATLYAPLSMLSLWRAT
jgi:hypothetical protein